MSTEPEVKFSDYIPYRIMPIKGKVSGEEAAVKINEIVRVVNTILVSMKIRVKTEGKL